MSQRQMKRRIIDMLRRAGFDPNSAELPNDLYIACLDELPRRPPPLNTPEGWEYFDRVLANERYEFVVFDNVQALLAADDNFGAQAWQGALPWISNLTRKGIGQIWIDHTGYDRTRPYGSSVKSWQMD